MYSSREKGTSSTGCLIKTQLNWGATAATASAGVLGVVGGGSSAFINLACRPLKGDVVMMMVG